MTVADINSMIYNLVCRKDIIFEVKNYNYTTTKNIDFVLLPTNDEISEFISVYNEANIDNSNYRKIQYNIPLGAPINDHYLQVRVYLDKILCLFKQKNKCTIM